MVSGFDLSALLTIFATVFVAELTDKDALLLLTLATKTKPSLVFAAGSTTFVMTTAIIVLVGSALLDFIPVFWIKVGGGTIMLAYAAWGLRGLMGAKVVTESERKLVKGVAEGRSMVRTFVAMVVALATLDLAGDATELVIIVFVARFGNILIVFVAASVALVAAAALETVIGRSLIRFLSPKRIQYLSVGIFLIIGASIILTSVF